MTQVVATIQQDLIPADAVTRIKEIETAAKEIKKAQDEMKATLMAMMKEYGITSMKSEDETVQVTLVPETESVALDSKALKEECRDVWDAYAKVTKKAAYVRVTTK